MSFILDALRKSDAERQRQSGPGIAEAGYRPPAPKRSVWVPVLIAVLAANLMLLAAFWWRDGNRGAVPTAAAPATIAPAEAPVAAVPTPHVVTPASAARSAESEDLPMPTGPSAPGVAGYEPPRTEILEPPSGAAPLPGAAAASASGGGSTGDLPSADQLVTAGVLTGQQLHLDLHVFSTRPSERFVFINTRKYVEGAEVQDGVKVEQITPDGVVLSKNGTRFSLPRE
jgi:general secretion pathway protein B